MKSRDPSLLTQLLTEGYRFDFFQAVRLINRMSPDRDPLGYASLPGRECLRVHSLPSLSFPPSPIYDITRPDNFHEPMHMTIAFMGLTGPLGVLPRYYTELIMEQMRQQDRTMLDFFDIFTHRLVSLFYRAWEKYQVVVSFEAAHIHKKKPDRVGHHLLALMGLGTKGLKEQLSFPSQAILGYTGLLGLRTRSAQALCQVLSHYFGILTNVKQFVGQWVALAPEDQSRLNGSKQNLILGQTAMAGSQVWDQQARFQVELGPLSLSRFSEFLPSGRIFETLVQLIRFFAGLHLQFDIRLLLRAGEIPYCRLGEQAACPPQLGWTTWLKCQEFTHEQETVDVVFDGDWTPSSQSGAGRV
jgi:type VI secretion system protein ImpH